MSTSTASSGAASKGGSHTIGMIALISFAVGTMVGGGVFALSGVVIQKAGPAAIISYLLAGAVMMLSALCFAAVSSRAPAGTTGYAPLATILGPTWRFITMWAFYIMGVTGAAYVMISFSNYIVIFIPAMKSYALWLGIAAAVLLIFLNFGPQGLIGKAETYMVGFKVAVLILLIIFGLIHFQPEAFRTWVPHGANSIWATTALLFTAYTGFNVISNMAGSVKNAARKVPAAIIISIFFVAVIYVGVAVALTVSGTSGEPDFANQGVILAAQKVMGEWGFYLVAVAACVSTLSGGNANIIGSAELVTHMSANGDIPSRFGRLNKAGNPVLAVVLTGVIILILMGLGMIPGIGSDALTIIVVFCNVSAIIAMVVVSAAAFKIGLERGPKDDKVFNLPLGPVIPILAIVTALIQIPSLGWWQVGVGTAMVCTGFIVWAFRYKSDPAEVARIKEAHANGETPLLRLGIGISDMFRKHSDSTPPASTGSGTSAPSSGSGSSSPSTDSK